MPNHIKCARSWIFGWQILCVVWLSPWWRSPCGDLPSFHAPNASFPDCAFFFPLYCFRVFQAYKNLGTFRDAFFKKIIPLFRTNVQNTIHNKKKHVSPRIMTPPVCDSPSASLHSASIAFEASNCWSLLVAQKLPAFLLKTCCARPDSLEVLHLPRPCKLIFYALLASEIAHFL